MRETSFKEIARTIVVADCEPALPADPEITGIIETIVVIKLDKPIDLIVLFWLIALVNSWIINWDKLEPNIKIISQKILDFTSFFKLVLI